LVAREKVFAGALEEAWGVLCFARKCEVVLWAGFQIEELDEEQVIGKGRARQRVICLLHVFNDPLTLVHIAETLIPRYPIILCVSGEINCFVASERD
jgi:hypothetical protein